MRANLIVYTMRGVSNYYQISFEDEKRGIPQSARPLFRIEAEDNSPLELQETLETASQMTADNLEINIDICRSVKKAKEFKPRKGPKR